MLLDILIVGIEIFTIPSFEPSLFIHMVGCVTLAKLIQVLTAEKRKTK